MMRECDWCKSLVDVNAEICPTCGRIWDKKKIKKMNKKILKIFGLCILLIFVVIIVLVIAEPKVEDKCKNAEYANLEEIYTLHSKNVPQAEKKYENKYFKFDGKVYKTYNDYVQINSEYVGANVYFDYKYSEKAENYQQGEEISYCGKVKFGLGISVKNAMIIEKN